MMISCQLVTYTCSLHLCTSLRLILLSLCGDMNRKLMKIRCCDISYSDICKKHLVTPVHRPHLVDSMFLKASILTCKLAGTTYELNTPP
jgi:hypothetical protein